MGSIFSFALHQTTPSASCVGWELRYDGAIALAVIDRVPLAGISCPLPDRNYALTCSATREIDKPPSLEFFTSMATARRRVEDTAIEMTRTM